MSEGQAQVRRRLDLVLGLPIHARDGGTDGRSGSAGLLPIVLVHGLAISSASLIPALARLGRKQRACAPDLPGYGLSAKPPRQYSLERQADYLGAWMDRLRIERAVLVGCSLGSQLVSHLAVRRPEIVDRAVLVSPTMDPAARGQLVAPPRWLRELPHEVPMLPLMLRDYARAGVRRALHSFDLALADEPEPRLPQMSMPTLVLRGQLDPIVPQGWAEEVARLLPEGRLEVVSRHAHAVYFSAPAEFARLVTDFAAGGPLRGRRSA